MYVGGVVAHKILVTAQIPLSFLEFDSRGFWTRVCQLFWADKKSYVILWRQYNACVKRNVIEAIFCCLSASTIDFKFQPILP